MRVCTLVAIIHWRRAGSGESEIRRWILENDMLDAIILCFHSDAKVEDNRIIWPTRIRRKAWPFPRIAVGHQCGRLKRNTMNIRSMP